MDNTDDVNDLADYSAGRFKDLYLRDYDHYDGIYLEPAFSDSLFEVWKTTYTSPSSQLLKEAMSLTSNQFIQSVSDRIVSDITFQVVAQLTSLIIGAVVTAATSYLGPISTFLGTLAYAVAYGIINAVNALIEAETQRHIIRAQTFHNEDYEGQITLSSEKAYDELWGGTLPDITGFSTSGTYTEVEVETDKHLFKGTIVLAKSGTKKTDFFGTKNVPISLNYAMQTRSYIIYSDFDDPRLSWYLFESEEDPDTGETTTWAKDPACEYMTNTIMYLESAISQETNGEYTTIYPYIIYAKGTFIPRFQFTEENAKFPLPEFYHEYPIFTDSNAYEDLNDDYYTIYKVFDTTSSLDIELVPEEGIHSLFANVIQIDVYLITAGDSEINSARQIGTYGAEFFDFNNATGILTLDPDFSALKDTLYLLESDNPENLYYYVFEVKIEKYRDISDLQGFTQDEVDHIATMQAVEQSIFEYMYQYTHGCKTQQGLSEMFYTFFVTSISTLITTAMTLGIGLFAKALQPISSVNSILSGGTVFAEEIVKVSFLSVLASYATLGSWQMIKLILSPITETLQEIFVDPYLDVIVTKIIGDIGLGVFWQVLASSLVEAGRESLSGPMSTFLFGQQQQSPSSLVDTQQISSAVSSQQDQHQSSIEQTENLRSVKVSWSSVLKTGASLLLGTAMMSLGGPIFFGASLTMGFTAIKSSTKSFEMRKQILHNIISQKLPESYDTNEVTDLKDVVYSDALGELPVNSLGMPLQGYVDENGKFHVFELAGEPTPGQCCGAAVAPANSPFGRAYSDQFFASIPNLLTSKQIHAYSKFYQSKVIRMCARWALKFKALLMNEYGRNILDLKKDLSLNSHFERHFGDKIAGIVRGETKVLGEEILNRIKNHIIHKYKNLRKLTLIKKKSLGKVLTFINNYIGFSNYLWRTSSQGVFSISRIRTIENTIELAPKSWLFENIRYIFPKVRGLPIRDNDLSWFLFEDPPAAKVSTLKTATQSFHLFERMELTTLLSIDYRMSKMTVSDFKKKGIDITNDELSKLQENIAYIIHYYIFGGYHESTYVSKTTSKGLAVGAYYFTPEYFAIRSVFFLAAESNTGEPLNFEAIEVGSGVLDLKSYLYDGVGFSDSFDSLFNYVKGLLRSMPSDANMEIIRTAKEALDSYKEKQEKRRKEFLDSQGFASSFQEKVYNSMNDLFGVEFFSEKQLRSVVGVNEITTINDEGNLETIKVHHSFSLDCYLELDRALKGYLGLDTKWKGIAIEAQGIYWHSSAINIDRDRRKRLICKEKNIILLEIWDNWDENTWIDKIFEQLKEQTGIEIARLQLSRLRQFLGLR
jgi:hypothetical protein